MKTNKYQKRFYRNWVKAEDLYSARIVEKETDLQILTNKPLDEKFTREKIRLYRRQIESYITKDPRFLTSLKPIAVEINSSVIIKKMSQATRACNVGPMAAVAGAIAQSIGLDLLKKGFSEVIIENGGDIFLKIRKSRKIGIYAGPANIFNGVALMIKPSQTPLGVCASSGTIGHSLSFGSADAVIILAKNASLADAVATATGNLVGLNRELNKASEFSRSIRGVKGCVIILGNKLLSWGEIEFVR